MLTLIFCRPDIIVGKLSFTPVKFLKPRLPFFFLWNDSFIHAGKGNKMRKTPLRCVYLTFPFLTDKKTDKKMDKKSNIATVTE